MFDIIFQIENGGSVTVSANQGDKLLDVARGANVAVDAPCSGNGSCGKCRVKLLEGQLDSLPTAHISQEDYDAIAELSKDFVAHQLEIVDAVGMTAPDIISYARYRRYDVIYIDYLQLIRPTGGRNRTEEVSGISIALHNGARAARITVVALSQLSRPEKVNGKIPAPRMRNLRESGQLEQDADAIMLLYREKPDDPDSRRVLTLEKNKEGELATMYLAFDGATQSFRRHLNQQPPPKRKEPEYKQVTFEEQPGNDPDLPFKEGS